jgi:hypothetical protein
VSIVATSYIHFSSTGEALQGNAYKQVGTQFTDANSVAVYLVRYGCSSQEFLAATPKSRLVSHHFFQLDLEHAQETQEKISEAPIFIVRERSPDEILA